MFIVIIIIGEMNLNCCYVNSSNVSDELLVIDGQVRGAILQDIPLILFKVACSAVGVPLNLLVASVILRLRRLHSKPRNIFLLGITFSNLTAFVPVFFEVVYFFYPLDVICKCYVAVNHLPDIFLMLNIFLSLADRYVAIRHPLWHRKKVTVRRVVWGLVIAFTTAILISKLVFLVGLESFECAVNFRASRVMGTVLLALFVMCVAARIAVYQQTRKLLVHHRSIAMVETATTNGQEEVFCMANANGTSSQGVTSSNTRVRESVNFNQTTLHRIELEATKSLVAGVTSLFVLASPLLIYFVSISICRLVYIVARCNSYSWIVSYLKQLLLVHAIYHPVIYLAWNRELSAAVFKGRRFP